MSERFLCIETQITEIKKNMENVNAEKYKLEGALGVLEELKSMGVVRISLNETGDGRHYHHISKPKQVDEDTKTQE